LTSPEVAIVPSAAPFLGTLPRGEDGVDRVRTVVVDFAADGTTRSSDCWCRLPGRERILESEILDFDGTRVLALLTMSAEKLSLFGEKLLRLCPLEPDRTKKGKPPLFAGTTRINLWQDAYPVAADANGDGRKDLVLGYWKGLKDDTVVLDAYLRHDGGFEHAPKTTTFDVEEADRDVVLFGRDLTGDGVPDLVVEGGGAVFLHAGRRSASGSKIVDPTPRWSVIPTAAEAAATTLLMIQVGTGGSKVSGVGNRLGDPFLADVGEGDRLAIVMVDRAGEGRSRLVVVRE
jgi:hypothetical protein